MDDLKSILIPGMITLMVVLLIRFRKVSLSHSALACGLFLVPFALAVLCCFPSMDDWSYVDSVRHGWWSAQRSWYHGWSGRIGATAVLSSWGLIGNSWFAAVVVYRLVLVLIMVGLGAVLWDLSKALLQNATERSSLRDQALVTMAIAAAWISVMPDLTEGLYWLAGAATYSIGTGFGLLAFSCVLHALYAPESEKVWRWRVAVGAAFLAPLFSEVVAVLVCSVLGMLVLKTPGRNRWRVLAPLLAAVLGLAIVALAPGNILRSMEAARQGQVSGNHALFPLLFDAARMCVNFLADSALAAPAALALLIATQVSVKDRPRSNRVAIGILLATLGLIGVAALPMAWTGMSPLRAWNPVSLVVSVGLVTFALKGGPSTLVVSCLSVIACGSLAWQAWIIPGGLAIFLGGWLVVGLAIYRWWKDVPLNVVTAALAVGFLCGSPRFIDAVRDVFWRGPAYVLAQQRRLDAIAVSVPGGAIRVAQLPGDLPYLFHHADIDFNEKTWQNSSQAAFFNLASLRGVPPPLVVIPAVSEPGHSAP